MKRKLYKSLKHHVSTNWRELIKNWNRILSFLHKIIKSDKMYAQMKILLSK